MKNAGILFALAGIITIITGLVSIIYPEIYLYFVDSDYIAESLGQDAVSVLIGILLTAIAVFVKKENLKTRLSVLGLLAYLIYAYSIYAFGSVYNALFFNYIAIIGLSAFSAFFIVADLLNHYQYAETADSSRKRLLQIGVILFLIITSLILGTIWISSAAEHISNHTKARETVIYVLDLSLVLPLFLTTAVLLLRKKTVGRYLSVVCMMNALVLGLSIAAGQAVKYISGMEMDWFLSGFFGIFTLAALLLYLPLNVSYPRGRPV